MSNVICKNSFQRLLVFLTLFVFITANIGFAVFTHSCSISGVEKSLFVSIEETCGDDHPVEKKSCCSKDKDDEVHFEKSCCSTDTDYVALDVDSRVEHFITQFVLIDFSALSSNFQCFYPYSSFDKGTPVHLFYSDLPPPKLQGRDFQSIHQVYVI